MTEYIFIVWYIFRFGWFCRNRSLYVCIKAFLCIYYWCRQRWDFFCFGILMGLLVQIKSANSEYESIQCLFTLLSVGILWHQVVSHDCCCCHWFINPNNEVIFLPALVCLSILYKDYTKATRVMKNIIKGRIFSSSRVSDTQQKRLLIKKFIQDWSCRPKMKIFHYVSLWYSTVFICFYFPELSRILYLYDLQYFVHITWAPELQLLHD